MLENLEQTSAPYYLPSKHITAGAKRLSLRKRARVRQIAFCSRWIGILTGIPSVSSFIRITREMPVVRRLREAIIGHSRPFATLKEAEAFIADYDGGGHSHPYCATNEMRRIENASPSDYAALFFLRPILPTIQTSFDLGGSVGNLYYCYSKYLDFANDFTWTVFDVAENVQLGKQIAHDCGEHRLRFTVSLNDGDGVDLFIATGALHYFETPLPDIIAGFKKKPRYVLVNRTPLTDGPPFATVQDAGRYRVACMVYNHDDLIHRFEATGYELVESWRAAERSLFIPCYPDRSVSAYSGMFFRLREGNG